MTLEEKTKKLEKILSEYNSVAVAFSGGKDSFFVLKTALDALGKERVTAFFVDSLFTAEADRQRLDYFQSRLDFKLERIHLRFPEGNIILKNPLDRCYHCKHKIFSTLLEETRKRGIEALLDGTTHSDLDHYRPGLRALQELEVISPLEQAEINETDIQLALRQLDTAIDPYYLTSSSCLATRIPYDTPLTNDALRKVDAVESFIIAHGIYPVRARYTGDTIRIEIPKEKFLPLLDLRQPLIDLCKQQNIPFISLDLEGIRSGIWDPPT
jgi:uncharacterized protein